MRGPSTAARPRVRPWMWVAGIVVVAWGVVCAATLQMSGWLVQTDELQHVRLAMDAASSLSPVPSVHEERFAGVSQLYSLLIAPAFRLLSVPAAFTVIHLLNALFLASAAVPTFLICRRVVNGQWAARAVAFLAVITPWTAVALPAWSEPLAYPVFLWAVWAIYSAVLDPSPRRDLIALAVLVVAFFTRTQFLTLWLAFPAAVVLHEVGYPFARARGRARFSAAVGGMAAAVRGHRLLLAVLIAAAAGLLVVGIAPLLGPYAGTVGQGSVLPSDTLPVLLTHVAIIGLGMAVLPMVAGVAWMLSTAWRPQAKPQHAFAVVAVVAGGGLMVQASTFVVRFGSSAPTDRYFFYVVPLLLIAAAALLLDGPRRPVALIGAAGLFCWALTKTSFEVPQNVAVSPGTTLNTPLQGRGDQVRDALSLDFLTTPSLIRILAWTAVALVVAALLWRRSAVPRIAVVVSAVMLTMAASAYAVHSNLKVRDRTDAADWVDQADLSRGDIGMMPSRLTPNFDPIDVQSNLNQWWTLEFRNKSITRPYSINGSPQYTPFPGESLTPHPNTGRLSAPHTPRYLVLDKRRVDFGPVGPQVARHGQLRVVDLGPRPRTRWSIAGLTAGATGILAGGDVRVEAFPPPGAGPTRVGVAVTIANPPGAPPWRQTWRLSRSGSKRKGTVRGKRDSVVRFGGCVDGRPLTALLGSGALGRPFEGESIGLIVKRVRVSARPGGCAARPGTG